MIYIPSDFDIFETATRAGRMRATLVAKDSQFLEAFERASEQGVRYSTFFEAILTRETSDTASAFYANLVYYEVERVEALIGTRASQDEIDSVNAGLVSSALRTYLLRTNAYRLAFFDECFRAGLESPLLSEGKNLQPVPV